jgi:hypothetical protein
MYPRGAFQTMAKDKLLNPEPKKQLIPSNDQKSNFKNHFVNNL